MTGKMLAAIDGAFALKERSCGEYAKLKVSGMNFSIRRFEAAGLGSVSLMRGKGFFGLMKMDTLIITPTEVDMPLFSYDRVLAMGNDTLIFELYDTLLGPVELTALEQVKARYAALPDHALQARWYDAIKLPVSLSKKGKKQHTEAFDRCAGEYLQAYLQRARGAVQVEAAPKREKAAVYVEGLLENGGTSTDVFVRSMGLEKTAELFRKYLFATQA